MAISSHDQQMPGPPVFSPSSTATRNYCIRLLDCTRGLSPKLAEFPEKTILIDTRVWSDEE